MERCSGSLIHWRMPTKETPDAYLTLRGPQIQVWKYQMFDADAGKTNSHIWPLRMQTLYGLTMSCFLPSDSLVSVWGPCYPRWVTLPRISQCVETVSQSLSIHPLLWESSHSGSVFYLGPGARQGGIAPHPWAEIIYPGQSLSIHPAFRSFQCKPQQRFLVMFPT